MRIEWVISSILWVTFSMYLFAYFLLWRSVQPELVYPHRWSHTNVNGASPPPTVSSWLLLQKTSSKSAFWPTLETALCGSFFDFQPKIQRIRPFLNLFLIYCTYFKYFFFFFLWFCCRWTYLLLIFCFLITLSPY